MTLRKRRSHCQLLAEFERAMVPGRHYLKKLRSKHARVTIDIEDRRIYHMSGEHCSASTAEIAVSFGTRVTQ
ncbi:hypothetical protein TNCV_3824011 [Trichonephila clavipes]|nr:hypothetical protein TNCV_3824011 [Trichonephila clavipes]